MFAAKEKLIDRLVLREIFTVAKFGIVGLVATCMHLAVALWMISMGVQAILANFIAFLCAFSLSFLGHFKWTFNSRANCAQAFTRFFFITLIAFIGNNAVLMGLIEKNIMSEKLAVSIAVLIIPVITFVSSRIWVFKT